MTEEEIHGLLTKALVTRAQQSFVVRAAWAAEFNRPFSDPSLSRLTTREAMEDIRIARTWRAVQAERFRAAKSYVDDDGNVVEPAPKKPSDVRTGNAASPLADSMITTGDPEVDRWEREEMEADEGPLRYVDGPAAPADVPAGRGLASKLAAYTREV